MYDYLHCQQQTNSLSYVCLHALSLTHPDIQVTALIYNNPGCSELYGTNVVETLDGVARFTDLMIEHAAREYRLQFLAGPALAPLQVFFCFTCTRAVSLSLFLAFVMRLNTVSASATSSCRDHPLFFRLRTLCSSFSIL